MFEIKSNEKKWVHSENTLYTHIYISIYMYISNEFSLFRVDMFYKVTLNTKLPNIEPLLLEEI